MVKKSPHTEGSNFSSSSAAVTTGGRLSVAALAIPWPFSTAATLLGAISMAMKLQVAML